MLFPTTPDDLRRRRLVVASVAALLLLIAFVTYAVLVHRSHTSITPPSAETDTSTASPNPARATPVPVKLGALPRTDDPEEFARDVAEAIFAWDTSTMINRDDHIEQLVKVGDPTGESTAGLLSDLETYLPTADAWVDLAQYETRQWLTIDSITVPTKWAQAEAQAGSTLLPGTTAYTIRGTRNRSGVWDGEPVSTTHPVAFTVFIVCGPSYPQCHLLRISKLDNPLD